MKIKTVMIKLSPEEKKQALKARAIAQDDTWEDFFNRLVQQELANNIDKTAKHID